MIGVISEDENHNKTFKPMAGATLGQGVPLGAWCSFEKDVAPSNNWLMAGTTFDATKYPALNLYLGTNVVPCRYDHSRLGEVTDIFDTWVNAGLTTDYFTAPYDGYIIFTSTMLNSGATNWNVYQSEDNGTTWQTIGAQYRNGEKGNTITIPIKKGCRYYGKCNESGSDKGMATAIAEYFTHPLFIKATSIASDSDKDSILAQIQEYNTYSTEETLTGKTWTVDGVEKPVYRKVYTGFTKLWADETKWYTAWADTDNIEAVISHQCWTLDDNIYADTSSLFFFRKYNGNILYHRTSGFRVAFDRLCLEYTKTTD